MNLVCAVFIVLDRVYVGIRLDDKKDDKVIGMEVVSEDDDESSLLTICENGYGKRTLVKSYPLRGRYGKGVITIKTTKRNGKVVAHKDCV